MESHRLDPDTVMLFPGGGEAPWAWRSVFVEESWGLAGKVAVIAPFWPERVVRDGGFYPAADHHLRCMAWFKVGGAGVVMGYFAKSRGSLAFDRRAVPAMSCSSHFHFSHYDYTHPSAVPS
jgi:hypothetical protein